MFILCILRYISLASYNPDHLRDLAIHIPDFGRVILKLFDETEHIRVSKTRSICSMSKCDCFFTTLT